VKAFARFGASALIASGTLSLSGCYNGPASTEPGRVATAGSATVYPAGVLSAAGAQREIAGIYPAPDAASCCWTGPDVRFRVRAAAGAKTLSLRLYEPNVGNLATSRQQVSLLDAGGRVFSSAPMAGGIQTITLRIPPGAAFAGELPVRLRMSASIVPRDIGLNSDPRHLSLVLVSARAR
jgi:hypothetical protein